ncbi:hypothetical protein BGX28_005717 [Mortierella sp. GBA30]|nr:hypothetical protein BGX28_005717 [Mortierella sp. GBA30]
MERSFSHLLRTSRLATFDRNVAQIYTTSGKAKAIGDWGLKRNLPTVLRTHYLNIEQLDTAEHQTPFQSAASDYLFLQRWKENFPRSRPPQPQPLAIKKDLSTMTDAEYKKLLAEAREKRQAWKEALSKNEVRADDHLNYLNIMTRHSAKKSIDTATSQSTFATNAATAANSSIASSAPLTSGSNTRVKVGPTYGFFEPSTPTIVQGRSLGRSKTNQFIGVCGVVAALPTYTPSHLYNTTKSLQPYYVHKAEIEADGRPNVVLGLTPPQPGGWLAGVGGGRPGGMHSYGANRMSSQNKSVEGAAPSRKVVSRVQGLLESRDKSPTRS